MPIFRDAIRVLVISDHPYTRVGIVNALTGQERLQVVGQSASDAPLDEMTQLYSPDVIVWEVPRESAYTALRMAEMREVKVPILVLLHDDQRAPELIAAGARGLLTSTADAETIALALQAIAANMMIIHADLPLITPPQGNNTVLPALDILTNRELEVLRLVAEGLPNKQIALKLNVSEHTVKFHINAIMGKLGVQSRTEAVVRATRQGLIAL